MEVSFLSTKPRDSPDALQPQSEWAASKVPSRGALPCSPRKVLLTGGCQGQAEPQPPGCRLHVEWPGGVAGWGRWAGGPLAKAQEATIVRLMVVVDPWLMPSSKLSNCPPERVIFLCGSYTSIKDREEPRTMPSPSLEAALHLPDGANLLRLLMHPQQDPLGRGDWFRPLGAPRTE